jgi:S-formylglutathione hydrolase FrmB
MTDRTFHSDALERDVTYRVIAPASFAMGQRVRVVYLLHGNGANYREWSELSQIAPLALKGYVLVMPEGHSAYYVNSVSDPKDRYEDFLTRDLVADAERGLHVDRADRMIAGVSMGGYGAMLMALKHPEMYGFAGGLSTAVDITERPFRITRLGRSLGYRKIFGPAGSAMRVANDPFVLAAKADPARLPFLFLSAGENEPLLGPGRRFAAALQDRGIAHEFRTQPGAHDWAQWNSQLPALIAAMDAH